MTPDFFYKEFLGKIEKIFYKGKTREIFNVKYMLMILFHFPCFPFKKIQIDISVEILFLYTNKLHTNNYYLNIISTFNTKPIFFIKKNFFIFFLYTIP